MKLTFIILQIIMIYIVRFESQGTGEDCKCSTLGSISQLCDLNGRCSCLTNFYGEKCQRRCNCSFPNSVFCNAIGQCVCNDGFYGSNCSKDCDCIINGSAQYKCDKSGYCDCKKNKWGKRCEKDCNCDVCSSLADTCDVFGKCPCKPNYRGKLCDIPCNCVNSDDIHTCDSIGLCICKPGYYGASCDQKCICDYARDNVCDINGYCKCEFEFYGPRCNKVCDCDTTNSTGRCDALGYCKCMQDSFGEGCNKTSSVCGTIPSTLKNYEVQIPIDMENRNVSYYRPWVVKILKQDKYICTGVVVIKDWILTLRRCFTDDMDLNYLVKTGDYSHWHHDIGERTYSIKQIIFQDISNDKRNRIKSLALVKLGIQIHHPSRKGYVENSFSQAICVAGIPSFADVADIGSVLFTGWYKRADELPSTMRSQTLNVIPSSNCLFALEYESDEIICARVPNNFQATSLDQYGAPITAIISEKHSLFGLWIKQDKDCSSKCLAYFVNTIKYSDWIINNIFV